MNEILKGLIKVTQDVAKLALEIEVAKHTPVVVVETRPRNVFEELLWGTPPVRYVETTRPRRCTAHTPWQVCENRDCVWHAGEDRRDMSKLR